MRATFGCLPGQNGDLAIPLEQKLDLLSLNSMIIIRLFEGFLQVLTAFRGAVLLASTVISG
jgi:hypothetical protein